LFTKSRFTDTNKIVEYNNTVDGLYFIIAGEARVIYPKYRAFPIRLRSSTYFGEFSLLNSVSPYDIMYYIVMIQS
jgi:hypothetical protein